MIFALARALAFAALFMGFSLVFLPGQIIERWGIARPVHRGAAQLAGGTLAVTGGALALWCVVTFALRGRGTPAPFDPPRRLVVMGPYRLIRNPMYVGAVLVLVGAAAYYESGLLLGYAALFLLAAHAFVLLYEEPTLGRLFGAEYAAYRRAVPRWWPLRRGRAQ